MTRKNILTQEAYDEKYVEVRKKIEEGEVDFSQPIKVIIAAGDAKGCAGGNLFLDVLDDLNHRYEYKYITHQQIPKATTSDKNIILLEEMFDIKITINEYDILDLAEELEDGGLGGFESEHFKHARLRKFIVPTTAQTHQTLMVTGHTGKNNRMYETSHEFREAVDVIITETPIKQYVHKAPWGSNLYITACAIDTEKEFTQEAKDILASIVKPNLFNSINPSIHSDLPKDIPNYWSKLRKLFDDNAEEVERIKQWEVDTQREFLREDFMKPGTGGSLWGLWNECMQKSIPSKQG